MKRRESWADARRPTEAEKRKAKRLLSAPRFPPKSAYENILTKKERKARKPEALVEDFARCAEQGGCPHCEGPEAHLHGTVLYEEGRPLF